MPPPGLLRDPGALLTHGDFVRALARSLLDEHRAEDVVQQTWLAALESPPRSRGKLRAWLAVVARNFATRAARGEGRRARREAAAARPEAVPSTAEVFEREAARRRVVEAVVALAEPYRSAVLLRYFESLPPREIALRLGVPVGTVRTRLKRALEQLRLRLDREHGGDRRAWCLALAPLAAPSIAEAAAAVTGVLAMKAGTKAAVALLLLGGSAAIWESTRGRSRDAPDSGAALASAAGERTGDEGTPAPPPAPSPPEAVASASAEPSERRPLEASRVEVSGRVVDDRGAAVGGAAVLAAGRTALAGEAGEFRLGLPAGAAIEVRASHPEHFDGAADWPGRESEPLVLTLPRKISIAGVVLDPSGRPVAGAKVCARDPGRADAATDLLLARGKLRQALRFAVRAQALAEVAAERHRVVRPRVPSAMGSLRASLSDPLRRGAAGASVELRPEILVESVSLETRSGPDGSFVLAPLRPGPWSVDGDTRGGPIDPLRMDLESSVPDLVLRALGGRIWIAGLVRDCRTGAPIPRATLHAIAHSPAAHVVETAETSEAPAPEGEGGADESDSPEAGGFRFALWDRSFAERAPARLMLGVAAEGHAPAVLELAPDGGGEQDLRICLEPASAAPGAIEAEVRFEDGTALEGRVEFRLVRPGPSGPEDADLRDEAAPFAVGGTALLVGLAPGDWVVCPSVPGTVGLEWERAKVVRVLPGGRTRARWTLPRGGEVTIEASDGEGRPAPEFTLVLENESRRIEVAGRDGRATLAGVPPGTYRLAEDRWLRRSDSYSVVLTDQGGRASLVVGPASLGRLAKERLGAATVAEPLVIRTGETTRVVLVVPSQGP